ncbi:YggT family protein [Thermosipho atlanticus]|uniref:YggT family protein n=1 Tax=Thermosipho atlanticus DSM 15807 TaxID=1123380 RepID=A0A1M5R3Y6_9BACT|nr:YggT family protein [Thermosipho atlanticus]SHH21125.1 YggT family protein [Thermosipho atlanticus DSM 15807]
MFIIGNFLIGLGVAFRILFNIETAIIVISAILSWIPEARTLYYYLQSLADIVERPIRRIIPRIGPVDVSPIIAIVLLVFLDRFLIQSIIDLGYYLK